MIPDNPRIGFIGFGEVGYYFAKGLKEDGVLQILAYDKNVNAGEHGHMVRRRAADAGVLLTETLAHVVDGSDLIISSVWGNVALEVARETSALACAGKVYGDINNTAPSAKERGAAILTGKGVRFIDMALFTSPSETKHRSFILISGDGADSFKAVMSRFGMNMDVVPGAAGKATTIKTLVNIYYKGVQALCLELALSAWRAEVDLELLSPLVVKPVENLSRDKELPFWMVRGAIHATRKAAELESISEAVEEWGLKPIMVDATRERLQLISRYDLHKYFKGELAIENFKALMEAIDEIGKKKGIGIA
jgi:3-hydroxyisobutyrate dehydrogenase-like beta-hydroxyacid dehydrogenase